MVIHQVVSPANWSLTAPCLVAVMCVGPGQREAVDRGLVQRAGAGASGRTRGGGKVDISQRPRLAPPSRAAPAIPKQAPRPAASPPGVVLR